ncbi:hypothetical protein EJ08DRAFT_647091 [Tothia fuscella]|uniref:CRAL-TRIO domain-containing protein n=1 Tax=Tothia fuscella TaxID=1048955 RepID=A0A9P4NYP8_9PEZI|nr:hypothetical protein EJ08DRAFT_647091 [Tothia fuscella]
MSLRIPSRIITNSTYFSAATVQPLKYSAFGFRRVPPKIRWKSFHANKSRLSKSFGDVELPSRQRIHIQQAHISWTTIAVVSIAIGASIAFTAEILRPSPPHQSDDTPHIPIQLIDNDDPNDIRMANTMPPGRPGNLTLEQEIKLRELWALALRVFGVSDPESSAATTPNGKTTPPGSTLSRSSTVQGNSESSRRKKGRLSLFRKKHKDGDNTESETSTLSTPSGSSTSVSDIAANVKEDNHGTAKNFRAAIQNTTPSELRNAFWSMVKHDHPDALLLRFLRARKWDVNAALVMAISALHWRATDSHVDSDVILRGEEGMLNLTGTSDAVQRKEGEDFMQQVRMGKSFLHGFDKEGRPICYVRVRLHKPGEQSEASLERFTVFTIETARMFLRPPVDTATVIFDMTDFGMANMDYTPVKFMIKCFEANYPESLGTVLVHKAPWIFQGIWRVIKGWLDPVVAAKVHFTNNLSDLEDLIPQGEIIKELGGTNPWSYKYPEPVPGENAPMKDTLSKQRLEGERADLSRKYESVILDWIATADATTSAPSSSSSPVAIHSKRDEVAAELRKNYWKLDPFVRARSLYDRNGELKPELTGDGQVGDGDLSKRLGGLSVNRGEADGRPSIDSDAGQSFVTAKDRWEDDLD